MSRRIEVPAVRMTGTPSSSVNEDAEDDRVACAKPSPSVLTIEEAAKLMRIGRNSAYEAARRGQIPTVRIGRRLLVPRVALERMLERAGTDSEGGRGS